MEDCAPFQVCSRGVGRQSWHAFHLSIILCIPVASGARHSSSGRRQHIVLVVRRGRAANGGALHRSGPRWVAVLQSGQARDRPGQEEASSRNAGCVPAAGTPLCCLEKVGMPASSLNLSNHAWLQPHPVSGSAPGVLQQSLALLGGWGGPTPRRLRRQPLPLPGQLAVLRPSLTLGLLQCTLCRCEASVSNLATHITSHAKPERAERGWRHHKGRGSPMPSCQLPPNSPLWPSNSATASFSRSRESCSWPAASIQPPGSAPAPRRCGPTSS
jgi:hypothetical protein